MEVHHHSHTPDSHRGRKKWIHYFWEFLMLFLAVFCGFLAEYQLEHRIEKERGKQFVMSFYEDLKTDTGRISHHINFDHEKLIGFGNLNNCFDTVSKNFQQTNCLVTLIKYASMNLPFKMTGRTLNQLSNAGGFRLLKKQDADSILAYQKEFYDFDDFQSTSYQDAQDFIRSTINLVTSFDANSQMFRQKEGQLIATFDEKEVTAPVLLSNDKNVLNKFFNEFLLYYRTTYNHKAILINLKASQVRLIEHFKSKYHFE